MTIKFRKGLVKTRFFQKYLQICERYSDPRKLNCKVGLQNDRY